MDDQDTPRAGQHRRAASPGHAAIPTNRSSPIELLTRASDGFASRLAHVQLHQWIAPTPCAAWDVHALVNHVVGANRRYTMLLHGATAADVDATRSADHLGDNPGSSFATTLAELYAAFYEPDVMARHTDHPAGARTGAELLALRVVDITVHTWDLARSIGVHASLDDDTVAFGLTLRDVFAAGRTRGSFALPPVGTSAETSTQARLLLLSGRQPGWRPPDRSDDREHGPEPPPASGPGTSALEGDGRRRRVAQPS